MKSTRRGCRARQVAVATLLLGWLAGTVSPAFAHDPVFGIGPHVVYKGGIETAVEVQQGKAGSEKEIELGLEMVYGVTADWAVGAEVPWVRREEGADDASGRSDVSLFTKYRFWRRDSLGVQESAAVALKGVFDTARGNTTPALGSGANDAILGLTYGYESLKWYRWAAARYRANGKAGPLDRGDKVLVDLVGGIRLKPPVYLRPDAVWLLELNGEFGTKSKLNGMALADSGGTEVFLSPGIFWTLRNFAVKAGVQLPLYSDLNGARDGADYRAKLVLEWHL